MKILVVLLGICILILDNHYINCEIASDIFNYYNSETVNSFKKQWETSRKAYENALKIAIKEIFGAKSLNTIERKLNDGYKITNGFYVNDNIVHMFFQDIFLKELPHVRDLEIYFPLGDNVLKLQTQLSKMILETKYSLMRNDTVFIFAGSDKNDQKISPFAHQQVHSIGQLAIIAEDCSLSGFAIARISGESVFLGQDTFKISNCKFTVEISADGVGSPPVIAPYFSKQQGALLQNLITKPLRKELMGKLQAAIFTYVNTSIFKDDLSKYRNAQEKIFQQTSKFFNKVIQKGNKDNVQVNNGAYDLLSLDVAWAENHDEKSVKKSLKLKNIVVEGFDSAYSPHIGGPYKLQIVGIIEKLKYASLKFRGKIVFVQDYTTKEFDFSMDLLDVTVNVHLNLGQKSQGYCADTLVFWRDTDFSITNTDHIKERVIAESIISGYIINEVPKFLNKKHMELMFLDKIVKQRNEIEKENVNNESIEKDGEDKIGDTVKETESNASNENPAVFDNDDEILNETKEEQVYSSDSNQNSEDSEKKNNEKNGVDSTNLEDSQASQEPQQNDISGIRENSDLSTNDYNKDLKESENDDQSIVEDEGLSELEVKSKEEFNDNEGVRVKMRISVLDGTSLDDSPQMDYPQSDVINEDAVEIAFENIDNLSQSAEAYRRTSEQRTKKYKKHRKLNQEKDKMGTIKKKISDKIKRRKSNHLRNYV